MKNFSSTRMFVFALFVIFMTFQSISAITTSEVFQKYPNKIFIESGSYRGNGIQNALDAGFQEIYSIELAPHLHEYCCARFANNPHVHLYLGDSSELLTPILADINEPVTFWLDGHYSSGDTAKGSSNTPILVELASIAEHHIHTHTILIDDVRQFGQMEFDYINQEMIIQALMNINPEYTFSYEDGYKINDVLVAKIK